MIIHNQGERSLLAQAIGKELKGKSSPVLYAIAIPAALWQPWAAYSIYALVALMWIVPDRRIERAVAARDEA